MKRRMRATMPCASLADGNVARGERAARRRAFPHHPENSCPNPASTCSCIGNAIVDVIANATDDFLTAEGLVKGSMRLIDAEEAERLYAQWARRIRSAAVRPATRRRAWRRSGGRAGFIGQVAPDQLGEFYRHDLTADGRRVHHRRDRRRRADRALDDPGHARWAPDDEHLPRRRAAPAAERARRSADRDAAILYLEGYLWDPETPRSAMVRAIEVAREAGRKVAFTLSDTFCVDRHRDGFNELIDERPDRHPVRQPGGDRGAGRQSRTSIARSRPSPTRWRRWSSPAARTARWRSRGGERAEVAGRADRRAGRHDRRGRPVRRRLPARLRARHRASSTRCGSARSAPPRSSSITARAPRRTSGRWPADSLGLVAFLGPGTGAPGIGRMPIEPARRHQAPAPR